MSIPADLKRSLEASGVKFDEDGNIIDDDFLTNIVTSTENEDEDEDVSDEDDSEDEDSEDEDVSDEDDSEDEDVSDEDDDDGDDVSDEDDDDGDDDDSDPKSETPKVVKKTWSGLTPKAETQEVEDTNTNTDKSKDILAELRNLKAELSKKSGVTETKEETDAQTAMAELLSKEAEKFKQRSLRRLQSDLSREVSRRFEKYNVNYNDVITSQEWSDFLSEKVYGETIRNRYKIAIENEDWDAMVSVFDGFAEKVFKEVEEVVEEETPKPKKKSLDKLAVPANSKATRKPRKRKKYDFKLSEYSEKLDKMTRGKIKPAEFYEFENKFLEAEKAGRVNQNA